MLLIGIGTISKIEDQTFYAFDRMTSAAFTLVVAVEHLTADSLKMLFVKETFFNTV